MRACRNYRRNHCNHVSSLVACVCVDASALAAERRRAARVSQPKLQLTANTIATYNSTPLTAVTRHRAETGA
jgi:hypothetical protein